MLAEQDGDSNQFPCNSPVGCCGRQFKNWRQPYFSPVAKRQSNPSSSPTDREVNSRPAGRLFLLAEDETGFERAAGAHTGAKSVRWTLFSPWENPWIDERTRYGCGHRFICSSHVPEKAAQSGGFSYWQNRMGIRTNFHATARRAVAAASSKTGGNHTFRHRRKGNRIPHPLRLSGKSKEDVIPRTRSGRGNPFSIVMPAI